MNRRFLEQISFSKDFGRQMRFIAGPRQCGKTTLAKTFLKQKNSSSLYFNWDDKEVRKKFRNNWHFFYEFIKREHIKTPWICFDEIHKTKNWKNLLKSHFDHYEKQIQTIVTGSARLDLFRKSGDSLAGRYFLFHLMPLSLSELNSKLVLDEANYDAHEFIEYRLSRNLNQKNRADILEQLLRFSGFPEPFFAANSRMFKLWQKNYFERLVYEDINNLSQIRDLDSIASLLDLLPSKVANPLSINSLREDLELNHSTVKNYLKYLDLSYISFQLKPYSKNLNHMIRKETKLYFYDWTKVTDEAAQFENYIACELKSLMHLWNDSGCTDTELYYLRQKNKNESDFLLLKNKKPWLIIEVKLSSTSIESHHYSFARNLGNIPIIQIIKKPNIIIKHGEGAFTISADRIL